MLRSRDIVLFVLTIWFLLIAIWVTVWNDTPRIQSIAPEPSLGNTTTVSDSASYGAIQTQQENNLDRAATIARLKQKLAAGSVIKDAVPSVEVSTEEVIVDDSLTTPRTVERCAYPDDALGYVSRWPVLTVESELSEGARLYYTEEVVPSTVIGTTSTSTSVASETVRKAWLQLPQFPQPLATPACVPSEVIGVHTNGTLLFNADVTSYRNLDANTLVGYARDGYPIYGPYQGEVDSCGGYQHPTGYRYSIHPDNNTFLQCFSAAPQTINWY